MVERLCSNAVSLGWGVGFLEGFRMGARHQKEQAMMGSLEISDALTVLWARGEGWELGS